MYTKNNVSIIWAIHTSELDHGLSQKRSECEQSNAN